jgi:hypothetical protein
MTGAFLLAFMFSGLAACTTSRAASLAHADADLGLCRAHRDAGRLTPLLALAGLLDTAFSACASGPRCRPPPKSLKPMNQPRHLKGERPWK